MKKRNTSPLRPYRNSLPVIMERSGGRKGEPKRVTLTGIPRGNLYPYAGKNRGGPGGKHRVEARSGMFGLLPKKRIVVTDHA